MLKNYFKIAWRNIKRNPVVSLINISGLALGMAVAMIIGLWIREELSFNKNFPNYNNISQVMLTGTFSGEMSTDPTVSAPLADEIRNQFASDVKRVVLTTREEKHVFSYGDKKISASGNFAEEDFAKTFSLSAIAGSVNQLNDPSSVLISTFLAQSLFGNEAAVGKLIKMDNGDNLKVCGVYPDFPANSSLSELKYVASWNYYKSTHPGEEEGWNNCRFLMYVQLQDGISNDKVSNKIAGLMKEHLTDIDPVLLLHPMSKWHLYESFKNGKNVGGQIQYVWMFGLIGLFVLLLACINFMNLSTAKSDKRSREVGILKAIGSNRKQLIYRFLGESLFTVVIAFIVTLVLVKLSLPWFNQLTNADMKIAGEQPFFWLTAAAFVLLIGLVAGCYPAFYLSSFQPVKVLKGSFKAGRAAVLPRKILTVVQFFTSIFLIIATLIVLQQLNYTKNRPLGYSIKGLINIPLSTSDVNQHFAAIRNELMTSGAVADVAASSSRVNQLMLSRGGYEWAGKDPGPGAIFGTVAITEDFAKTVQWKFKEGRNFSRNFLTDSSGVIINEMAARYMGMPDAVGKNLSFSGRQYQIIGVINDAVMGSPFATTTPVAFFLGGMPMNQITVRLSPNISTKNALAKVKTVFGKYNPDVPFDYQFTDQQYAKQFRSVETTGTLARIFCILAIFIFCMGLYAMASFVAEQRAKEIGIRKILGASVTNLWRLLSGEFIVLTVVAFLIAVPVSYWSMSSWLENYNYRIQISWEVFALTGGIALLITLVTVSFQAIKAAVVNPVVSLRSE
jgi:ABC-type antimicrobial peptide transport system permease subunit